MVPASLDPKRPASADPGAPEASERAPRPPEPGLARCAGTCHALFVFDIGYEVDLEAARRRLSAFGHGRRFRHRSATHTASQEQSFPLVFEQGVSNESLAEVLSLPLVRPLAEVLVSVYRSGALSVAWRLPFECSFEELISLSSALYDDQSLERVSRRIAAEVQQSLGDSVERPRLAQDFEDYFAFHLPESPRGWQPAAEALWASSGARGGQERALARLLRAERSELSEQEVSDALSQSISYAPGEVVFVDWSAALLLGADVADELFVLELATVELLELRVLDGKLYRGIEEAYEILSRRGHFLRNLAPLGGDLARIARIQADQALLHEGVDNPLKLFGDDYLARLYRAAQERFHFGEWDAAIERKLETLDSIHQKLSDLAATRRSEILEWIIILLIAFEIVMSLAEKLA